MDKTLTWGTFTRYSVILSFLNIYGRKKSSFFLVLFDISPQDFKNTNVKLIQFYYEQCQKT